MTVVTTLDVHGGVAGVSAHLADLDCFARVLLRAADRLTAVALRAAAVAADPRLAVGGVLCPAGFAAVEVALGRVVVGGSGPGRLAGELELTGRRLLVVVGLYRASDQAVDTLVQQAGRCLGQAIGETLGPAAVSAVPALVGGAELVRSRDRVGMLPGASSGGNAPVDATATGPAAGGAVLTAGGGLAVQEPAVTVTGLGYATVSDHARQVQLGLAMLPGFLSGLLDTVPGGTAGWAAVTGSPGRPRSMVDVAATLTALGRLGPLLRETGRASVGLWATPAVPAPNGVAGLAQGLRDVSGEEDGPVRIRVQGVCGPHGRAWVVYLPGTADWNPITRDDPFDVTGDVVAMARRRTAAGAAALAAMRRAGIPRGEPVMLVGHSQGGMIAAALSSDPGTRREFTITHLVTVGSPVAEYPVPAEVSVLSLEHDDDLVPDLDGADNPDRASWITVRTRAKADPRTRQAAAADPFAVHELPAYERTAAAVDLSPDSSLRAWRAGAGAFFDGTFALGPAEDYTATRLQADRSGR